MLNGDVLTSGATLDSCAILNDDLLLENIISYGSAVAGIIHFHNFNRLFVTVIVSGSDSV